MALTEEAIAARAAIKQELGVLLTEMRSLGKRRMQPLHIAFAAEVLAFTMIAAEFGDQNSALLDGTHLRYARSLRERWRVLAAMDEDWSDE